MTHRNTLLAVALGAALLAGCATPGGTPGGESELVERVRQELALDPLLNTSRVTVTERDGVVVLGGFVEKLEDLDAIRETIGGVEGVGDIENNIILEPGS